jgi:hypothetical protein
MLGYDGQASWKQFVTATPTPFSAYVSSDGGTLIVEVGDFPRAGILVEGRSSMVFHQLGGRPSEGRLMMSWPLSLEPTAIPTPQLCLHPIILAHAWTNGQIVRDDIMQLVGRKRKRRNTITGTLTGNGALTGQLGVYEGLQIVVSTIFDAGVRPYRG